MMVAVFGTMLAALLLAQFRRKRLATVSVVTCLSLSVWLFLFEVYSPEYGFAIPWLRW